MKSGKLLMIGAALAALLLATGAGFAQPCSPNTGVILSGTSFCLQVCAFENYVYTLEGSGIDGPGGYPLLTLAAGCNNLSTDCDVDCDPLDPPDTLLFGGDPFDPDSYYGTNDCFEVHLYWVHDDVWTIEIFSFCDGCFCITLDERCNCSAATPVVEFVSGRDLVPQYFCATLGQDQPTLIRICGAGGPLLPDKPPVVEIRSGCDPMNTNCDVDCVPGTANMMGLIPTGAWIYNPANGCFELTIVGLDCGCGCVCICLEDFLAVDLISFDAQIGDRSVTLSWSTASETDNDRFEITRDNVAVASIQTRGSSSSGANYSWTDRNVVNGTRYSYTLMAVDVNGVRSELGTIEAMPEHGADVVTDYALYQNYPNPFNPNTSITFDLAQSGFVSLKVLNLLGQEVASLVNQEMSAGRNTVSFDATDLASGVYLYRLDAGSFTAMRKMVVLK